MTRRLNIAIALATTAVLLAGVAMTSPANASPTAAEPDDEVVGYAKQVGISVAEATQRLRWQDLAPDLDERLEVDLADAYGGIWIDKRTGRVEVGVVRSITTASQAIIDRAAAAVGLADGYDARVVARSWAVLSRNNDWLAGEIVRVNKGAKAFLSAGIATDLNSLSLGVPAADLSGDQKALVQTAKDRLSDGVVIREGSKTFSQYGCDYPYCDNPLRGAVKMFGSSSYCSAGFLAQSKVDSVKYVITAGHCIPGHGSIWSTKNTALDVLALGPVWTWYTDTYIGDMAIIRISDSTFWGPTGHIAIPIGPFVSPNNWYYIKADKRSVVGMRICETGAASRMTTCGEVDELGLTANVGGLTMTNLGYAEGVCGKPGDSGGPMFASHNAYGIVLGGDEEDCEVVYQGVRAIESKLNVNVLHATS